jgi:hypothetical protein
VTLQVVLAERTVLDVINEARMLHAKRERRREVNEEDIKMLAKKAVHEFKALSEVLAQGVVEDEVTAAQEKQIFKQSQEQLVRTATALQEVGLTQLDRALVMQLPPMINALATLADDEQAVSDTELIAAVQAVADSTSKVRVGVNQMTADQRDPVFKRKLRVLFDVLQHYVIAIKLSLMAKVFEVPFSSEMQLALGVREACERCDSFFADLLSIRA